MTQYPKRLIEVDLPIKKISEHARREKSIRQGHFSTLHIWWARRPLAACRAVLCAALWPDPVDPICPEEFKKQAAFIIKKFFDPMDVEGKDFNDPLMLRKALLDFIADFSDWNNSSKQDYIEVSCKLTNLAHESLGGFEGTKPLVVDPFAGGGAIPLEAMRVGADVFASDLNPIPVILNKVVLEYAPKYGQQIVDEIRKQGNWIKEKAEKELKEYYPDDPDGSKPIAYLWARTIKCEGPGCGAEIPLIRSLWLMKKGKKSVSLKLVPKTEEKKVDFEIIEDLKSKEVFEGTVKKGSATCPCCGYTTPIVSLRRQLKETHGGADNARLFAIVTTKPNQNGRRYRLSTENDLAVVRKAAKELETRMKNNVSSLSLIPDEPTPQGGGSGAGRAFSQRNYGMNQFANLFTSRQALALSTIARLIQESGKTLEKEYDKEFSTAVQTCLSLSLSKATDLNNNLCTWRATSQCVDHLFSRQAIPITWDFAEVALINESTGSWQSMYNRSADGLKSIITSNDSIGQVEQLSAISNPLPDDSVHCFFTDPPYYDAVPYADLSDFFYVWLKRTISNLYPELLSKNLTPKDEECIVDEVKGKDKIYFETTMRKAMSEGRRILTSDGIGVIVFAHKTTEGWEAQLQAMIDAGWVITGSWPIDTEMGSRLRAMNSASLASSVHLVCRPREENEIGDWRDILYELPQRIHSWMPRLREEGIVGADAIFSCLGPALEIYSQYLRVEKASGEEVKLKEYLEHVWGAVSREALNMIFEGADATGFEEDARLTAMWLWTLKTENNGHESSKNKEEDEEDEEKSSPKKSGNSGLFVLEYDTSRKIAQGLGAHMEQMPGLVKIEGSSARLLSVEERTKYLFQNDVGKIPEGGKKGKGKQATLLNDFEGIVDQYVESGEIGEIKVISTGKTALDQVHQAMLLFAAGRGDALKRFLVEEGVGREDRFWRLAQALSALYPSVSNEKRWVDGVLARKKGLGF